MRQVKGPPINMMETSKHGYCNDLSSLSASMRRRCRRMVSKGHSNLQRRHRRSTPRNMGASDFFHDAAAPRPYRNSPAHLAPHAKRARIRCLELPKSSLEHLSKLARSGAICGCMTAAHRALGGAVLEALEDALISLAEPLRSLLMRCPSPVGVGRIGYQCQQSTRTSSSRLRPTMACDSGCVPSRWIRHHAASPRCTRVQMRCQSLMS
jgi:hypothetical protein